MEEQIDKLKVAEEQLVASIELFFSEENRTIAVHTLVRAAHEILDSLCANKNLTRGIVREGLQFIKPEHHKEVLDKVSVARNFFKHADRDPDDKLSWNSMVSEYYIWDAASLYSSLAGVRISHKIIIYQLWFRLHHSDLWDKAPMFDVLASNADDLRILTKSEFYKATIIAWQKGMFDLTNNIIKK